jgi:hypothetical protein
MAKAHEENAYARDGSRYCASQSAMSRGGLMGISKVVWTIVARAVEIFWAGAISGDGFEADIQPTSRERGSWMVNSTRSKVPSQRFERRRVRGQRPAHQHGGDRMIGLSVPPPQRRQSAEGRGRPSVRPEIRHLGSPYRSLRLQARHHFQVREAGQGRTE